MRYVLASGSPRRRELLAEAGVHAEVRVPDVDETPKSGETGRTLVERLSRMKARAVPVAADEVVIAADTVAVCDQKVLGKPNDRADAIAILELLSGTTHQVLTGVCVRTADAETAAVDATEITFRDLTRAEIEAYVDSGEAMGKAGAYAIQETGDGFVDEITGSWTNVVGLPMELLVELLANVGAATRSGSDPDRDTTLSATGE